MCGKVQTGLLYAILIVAVWSRAGSALASPMGEERRFLPWLTAHLMVEERRSVEDIAKSLPSIDLEIYFTFGSSVLQVESMPTLNALGAALTSPTLKDATLLIVGHTDGLESDDFATVLSLRRATAVKQYLVTQFKISSGRLVTDGQGSKHLKNAKNPFADENRRVEIINIKDSR